MREINHFCQNCILPNGFLDIILNEERICNFCRDPHYKNSNWSKTQPTAKLRDFAIQNWQRTIQNVRNKNIGKKYDCVLGYSGGKDSTALLDMLINELDLKPLAITVDTGQLTQIAKENIKKTLNTLHYSAHHLFIERAKKTFSKLYEYLFLNHHSNEKILTGKICDYCSDLIHSLLTKEAMKRSIPLVILGYSPDQIKRYFYEIPKSEIKNQWYPNFILKTPFTDDDREFFLNVKDIDDDRVPRILLPYHVISYKEDKIIEKVNSRNLIEKGKADPILTNCHVVKAALMYDLYRYGGLSYALQYAELVRQESNEERRKKSRKKWLRLYKNVAKSILQGNFDKKGIENFFNQINISKTELIQVIRNQLEKDPNKDLILENINLLK